MKLISEAIENVEYICEESDGDKSYKMDVLTKEVRNYNNKFVNEKRAYGELGHPDGPTVNLERVSHLVTELYPDGKNIIGEARILDTPMGKIVKTLMDEGTKLGVSSRGMGSLQENSNGLLEVQDDFELLCWDFVSTPSNPGSYTTTLNEGKIHSSYSPYTKVQNTITEILCSNGNCPIF